jgi:hypothetical protein
MKTTRVAAAVLLLALAACAEDRLRPGPPSLTLEMPPGNTVTSPDTFFVGVRAHDDNGLDSVTVTFLGVTVEVPAFDEVDVLDAVRFTVPEGHTPGELLAVEGYAKDRVGDRTTTSGSVTVVAGSATAAR